MNLFRRCALVSVLLFSLSWSFAQSKAEKKFLKQNNGKLLFTSKPSGDQSSVTWSNVFHDTSSIHAYYISQEATGGTTYYVYIDGIKMPKPLDVNTNPYGKSIAIHAPQLSKIIPTYWSFYVNKLKPGTHSIKIEVYSHWPGSEHSKFLASSEFELIRTATNINSGFSASSQELKSGINDAVSLKKFLSAAKIFQEDEETKAQIKKKDIVGGIITSKDWKTIRDEYTGATIRREAEGIIFLKDVDGACEMLQVYIEQKFHGNAWSDVFLVSTGYGGLYPAMIECSVQQTILKK